MMRISQLGVLGILAACGHPSSRAPNDALGGDPDALAAGDGMPAAHDAPHAPADTTAATPDAFPAVLDVHINCHNDCTLVATPPSIAVSAGTGFEVNWINTGDTPCDVSKIDQFNHVPIILGLEPGTSYHDAVRTWCGAIFTGTFEFEIDICTLPSYIPVNCGA